MTSDQRSLSTQLATGCRVLVVDDQLANRALLEAILEAEGHAPVVCESGHAALAHPEIELCDVALLDLRMPEMDGFELLERLRQLPGCVDMPVVFLTAYEDREIHERALKSGVDDFLVKPARKTEVLIRVRSLVALRRARTALEHSARELADRNAALEKAQEARRMLASYVVHDLKNPLQAISLGAHLLATGPNLGADERDIVRSIADGANRMKRLVVDLLDVEKGESGTFVAPTVPTPVESIHAMLWSIVRQNRTDIRIDVERPKVDGTTIANEELVQRVLTNVIDNAVKHTPTRELVRVTMDRDGDECRIRVTDRGPGIAPQHRPLVFQRFVQLDSKIPGIDRGHGLGLAFCQMAMRAMNGSIEALEGDGGVGSTFEMRLPMSYGKKTCA